MSLNQFYKAVGVSKQGFHQLLERSNKYHEELHLLLELIRQIRVDHPTMSCRSLYFKIKPRWIGRDKFEALCHYNGLRVVQKRNQRRTTDSSGVIRFDNLLPELKVDSVDQAWSSDITYFEIQGVFYYLTFILDNCSRRILGYQASSRLNTESTTLPALKMAIKNRGEKLKSGIIFHSDAILRFQFSSFNSKASV